MSKPRLSTLNTQRRRKITLIPTPGVDYKTKLQARLAWNNGAAFPQLTSDGPGRAMTRTQCLADGYTLGEVTIMFDQRRQKIIEKIPRPLKQDHTTRVLVESDCI